ncbi:hypothetical protein QR98_0068360 [Sarcoptes scabiei]|uniref:Aldehyde dehydrogenase domain-containing protein n=1 Tax=Sarcoptes scabiei TaxID=52283 RepID=A0A132ACY4_SARSC|nr:hypothetical protein QR98_0068360 [Sarcoptes scabiei]
MISSGNIDENILKINNFIDGKLVEPSSATRLIEKKNFFASFNPSNGEINAYINDSNENDVDDAVEAALKAFEKWSKTSIQYRAMILNRIASLIERDLDEFARLESEDQGKPLWQSLTIEIPRSILNFRHFANYLAYQTDATIIDDHHGHINYVHRHPVGVVGIITPWNLPLYLLTFKLAPAIAFGNTVVAKPSELTSSTAFRLCKTLIEADLPNGVINMVFGYGRSVGEAIVKHPSIRAISFTGSTETGKKIAINAAPLFKRTSLEMGGKNCAIIFDDFDFENDLSKVVKSVYFNGGQICLATSRLLIQRKIFDEFIAKFHVESEKIVIGDPFDSKTKLGPMVSKEHWEKIQKYIELARKNAKVIYIEPRIENKNQQGFFTGIAIIKEVDLESPLMREEIFGPVVCCVPFDNESDAISIANNTEYGLSATVWTASLDRMHRVSYKLHAGTVWGNCWLIRNLNMPFGGWKKSGIGHESSEDSREFFTEKKTICIELKPK